MSHRQIGLYLRENYTAGTYTSVNLDISNVV